MPCSQRSSKSPQSEPSLAAVTALVPQAAEESMSEAMLSVTGEKKYGTNMEVPKILKVGTNLGEQMGASLTLEPYTQSHREGQCFNVA